MLHLPAPAAQAARGSSSPYSASAAAAVPSSPVSVDSMKWGFSRVRGEARALLGPQWPRECNHAPLLADVGHSPTWNVGDWPAERLQGLLQETQRAANLGGVFISKIPVPRATPILLAHQPTSAWCTPVKGILSSFGACELECTAFFVNSLQQLI